MTEAVDSIEAFKVEQVKVGKDRELELIDKFNKLEKKSDEAHQDAVKLQADAMDDFKDKIRDALANFKESFELEQTKRMR